MPKSTRKQISAGLLLYRRSTGTLELLLAHPGGPFWKHRDSGAWTIPKGQVSPGETLLETACREFQEETGIVPAGPYLPLGSIQQKAGKVVHAWAWEGTADLADIRSNLTAMHTPAGWQDYPEIDRCEWFTPEQAAQKLNPAQVDFVVRLQQMIVAGEISEDGK